MEHNRKQKFLMIIALVLSIASLSIGFAAFSVSLNISSQASVSPSSDTFSVKFSTNKDSLVVEPVTPSSNPYNLTTTNGIIDNSTNPTIKGLSATFANPGQYVEYTFYARNEGEYTAYLNNINFLGSKFCKGEADATDTLVQSACDYINISVSVGGTTYSETTPITGHSLNKKTGEQIKVRLEYDSNGVSVDGAFLITFPNVALVYSTLDDSSIRPKVVKLESGDLNAPGGVVSIGDEKFYVIGQDNGNVKLLAEYNLLVGNSSTGTTITPLSNSTGKQDATAKGYKTGGYPYIGTTVFGDASQNGGCYSTYKGSIVEGYVNNYVFYLESQGANISSARVITKAELESLEVYLSGSYTCNAAPSWVYTTSYWGAANHPSTNWAVSSDSKLNDYDSFRGDRFGVRPVIEMPISEF